MDIFVKTYWFKPHIVVGLFQYKRYGKLGLKRVISKYLIIQYRRVSRAIIINAKDNICVNRYVVKIWICRFLIP